MAVLRFEVTRVTKEFDGSTCEVESKIISVHGAYFKETYEQISNRPLKVGDEFQEFIGYISRK